MAIIFSTKGHIDIRAFTTMGLSAKPGSTNPIGYFGTGLKYAIATLTRLGTKPIVWIGNDKYEFFTQKDEFRGQEYEKVRMKVDKWMLFKSSYTDLPFTTQYGRNWKIWMAFRELEANTRDEDGETIQTSVPELHNQTDRDPRFTEIIVDHPDFDEAYKKRDEIFLPNALRKQEAETSGLQIFPGQSKVLYWRGLKVAELPKPSLYTYNFLRHLSLTEDRTLDDLWQARQVLAEHLLQVADERMVKKIVSCRDDYWEYELSLPTYLKPSREFRRVMYNAPRDTWRTASDYFLRHDDRVQTPLTTNEDRHPKPWKLSEDGDRIEDAEGSAVFDKPYSYSGAWKTIALDVIRKVNR